jgi:non-canonical poly(A) RNA polymerase PAPD5/7
MWSTRRVLRGACEAPNAFDSEKALHAIVASCLAMRFVVAHGRNRHDRRTYHASTMRKSPEPTQTHQETKINIIRHGNNRQIKILRVPNRDDRQIKILRVPNLNKRDVPEGPRRESSRSKPVFGISQYSDIYASLWQMREDKHEMMEKRAQLDKGKSRHDLRNNMNPIPDSVEIRKHLMSVRNAVNQLRDCPDDEFEALDFHSLASYLRYRGRPIELLPTQLTPSSPMPWAVEDHNGLTGKQLLDEELRRLEEYLKLSDAEAAARAAVTKEFMASFTAVEGTHGTYGIELFGSEVTGLALPTSDLDFRAFAKADVESQLPLLTRTRQDVEKIARALDSSGKYGLVSFRKDMRHPIINCQHLESGIDIQVSWSPSTREQQRTTALLLARIDRLRSVYLVIRIMLGSRSLAEVYHGGLGSYGLFCMTACLLDFAYRHKRQASYTKYCECHPLTKAIWFLGAIEQRSTRLAIGPMADTRRWPDGPADSHKELKKENILKPRDPETGLHDLEPLLTDNPSIIDPANPKNDLGAKAYAFVYIKKTARLEAFRLIKSMITLDKAAGSHPTVSKIDEVDVYHEPQPITSLLLPMIGNYHERVQAQRARAEAYGKKVLSTPAAAALETTPDAATSSPTASDAQPRETQPTPDVEEVAPAGPVSKPAPLVDASRFDLLAGPEFDEFDKDEAEDHDNASESSEEKATSPPE